MEMRKSFHVTTDANGRIEFGKTLKLPLIPSGTLLLRARINSPAGVALKLRLDIDATDGNPSNPELTTLLNQGDRFKDVGTFRISWGNEEFIIRLVGETVPPRPTTDLEVEVEATI